MKRNLARSVVAFLAGSLALGGAAAADAGKEATAAASTCLSAAAWNRLDGLRPHPASSRRVIANMATKDVVLLGEHHDVSDDHRWQFQTLAALHAERPQMVIGFEMFPRRLQPVLDRWVAGELTARQFLEQSEWDKVWAMPAELYLPLFEFARINRVPMLALDVDEKLSQAIAQKGWEAVAVAEREGVSRPAPPLDAYREYLRDIYRQHPSIAGRDGAKDAPDGRGDDSEFAHFVESQTARDRAMAEVIAHRAGGSPGQARPLVVGIMGNGHVRFGWGVPHQLHDLGVADVGVLLPLSVETDCDSVRAGLADAVFALPRQVDAPVEPPRLGVRLESQEGKVSIAEVTAGSLAERSGLKSGDRLIEVAGQPASKIAKVIAAVRQQPGGTWLPVQVRRGEATLDLVIKFPARP